MAENHAYQADERLANLSKAEELSRRLRKEYYAEQLAKRIADIREGLCGHMAQVAPEAFHELYAEMEEGILEDLSDDDDLLERWEQTVRSLVWLACVAESEAMADLQDQIIEQLTLYHPASPLLEAPGFLFHFAGQSVNIDEMIDACNISDIVLEYLEDREIDVDRDKPVRVSIKKDQAGALLVEYGLPEIGNQSCNISLANLKDFAANRGEAESIILFEQEVRLRFGN